MQELIGQAATSLAAFAVAAMVGVSFLVIMVALFGKGRDAEDDDD